MYRKSFYACLGLVGLLAAGGCRQDMHNQPKVKPLRESAFFGAQRSARPLVEGTVARGELGDDEFLANGVGGGQPGTEFPFAVTPGVMARGRERFDIFCSPCHGRTGDGDGMVVRRGFRAPPSLHVDRLRQQPVGHFFDVITNGFGAMPDYKSQVMVRDRWAIIAYLRALQASTEAGVQDVPEGERAKIRDAKAK